MVRRLLEIITVLPKHLIQNKPTGVEIHEAHKQAIKKRMTHLPYSFQVVPWSGAAVAQTSSSTSKWTWRACTRPIQKMANSACVKATAAIQPLRPSCPLPGAVTSPSCSSSPSSLPFSIISFHNTCPTKKWLVETKLMVVRWLRNISRGKWNADGNFEEIWESYR